MTDYTDLEAQLRKWSTLTPYGHAEAADAIAALRAERDLARAEAFSMRNHAVLQTERAEAAERERDEANAALREIEPLLPGIVHMRERAEAAEAALAAARAANRILSDRSSTLANAAREYRIERDALLGVKP